MQPITDTTMEPPPLPPPTSTSPPSASTPASPPSAPTPTTRRAGSPTAPTPTPASAGNRARRESASFYTACHEWGVVCFGMRVTRFVLRTALEDVPPVRPNAPPTATSQTPTATATPHSAEAGDEALVYLFSLFHQTFTTSTRLVFLY